MIAISVVAGLTGCSGTSAPTKTVTVTKRLASQQASAMPSPTSTSPLDIEMDKLDEKGKVEYAKSANRAVIFSDYNIAKVVVARALQNGKFGIPHRYNDMKTQWLPGQTGWGGIELNGNGGDNMNKPGLYASVWLNHDGSINFKKGVTGMSVDAGPNDKGVLIFDSMYGAYPEALPYDVSLDQSGASRGKLWISCIDDQEPYDYCKSKVGNSTFRLTPDSTDMANLDMAARSVLDLNMRKLFGANWRALK